MPTQCELVTTPNPGCDQQEGPEDRMLNVLRLMVQYPAGTALRAPADGMFW